MRRSKPKADSADLLFSSLAEQVKLPFVQIAHATELSSQAKDRRELDRLLETISLASSSALKLIDSYLLSVRLQREPQLPLEPVSLGSVLYDTASALGAYAKAHQCEIDLQIGGKYEPVMARREVLQAALMSLGFSFIEASAENPGKITIAVRRSQNGINAGIFSEAEGLSSNLFKQAKVLKGLVRQPLNGFTAGSGAGVFVADSLFNYLESPLKAGRFHSLSGLSATLRPSHQLSFV